MALRGAHIPDIIIGCHNGQGEISHVAAAASQTNLAPRDFYANLSTWSYTFAMRYFCTQVHTALMRLLEAWRAATPSAQERATDLLTRLQAMPEPGC